MKVSGYVTHAIFPNESYKRICEPWTDEERSMAENALLLAAKQKTQDCKHMLKGQQQSPTASEGKVLEETEKKRVAERLPMVSKVDGKGAGNFTHFWVTNTHPTTQHILNEPPFRVLSAAPVINRFISESD